jgi:hypothetical protein
VAGNGQKDLGRVGGGKHAWKGQQHLQQLFSLALPPQHSTNLIRQTHFCILHHRTKSERF